MSAVPAELIAALRAVVGAAHVATGEAVALLDVGWNPHNLDAGLVVSPARTPEVAAVVLVPSPTL